MRPVFIRSLALALGLAAVLGAFSLASCGKKESPVTGGWSRADSPAVSAELRALFVLATDDFTGSTVEPVALLGSQVVSGFNYFVLCRTAPTVPDSVETYSLVTLYAAADGSAKITEIVDTGVATNLPRENLMGGWAASAPAIPDDLKARFDKAFEAYDSVYNPVAALSEQVVAGRNYRLLCETGDFNGPATPYAFVTVYENLQGEMSVTTVDRPAAAEEK